MVPERKLEQQVEIVTDSGCSVRPEDKLAEGLGVHFLPFEIVFKEQNDEGEWEARAYSDFELPPEKFYPKLEAAEEVPTTTGSVQGPALRVYEELTREGVRGIISLHVSAKLSGSRDSAYNAAEIVQEKFKDEQPPLQIVVIDSQQVSLGSWFLVKLAAKLAQEGASLEEIKEEVLRAIPEIELYAVLPTLKYLIKGGRVSAVQGFIGMLLKLIPILGTVDGEIEALETVRGVRKARRKMVETAIRGKKEEDEEKTIVRLGVLHTNASELAKEVREKLLGLCPDFSEKDIPIVEAGSALGTHGGPGAVGVAVWRKKLDDENE